MRACSSSSLSCLTEAGRALALAARGRRSARAGRGSGPSARPAGPGARSRSRERRALLGRVADARALGGELGGDQEARARAAPTPSVTCQLGMAGPGASTVTSPRRPAVDAGATGRRRPRCASATTTTASDDDHPRPSPDVGAVRRPRQSVTRRRSSRRAPSGPAVAPGAGSPRPRRGGTGRAPPAAARSASGRGAEVEPARRRRTPSTSTPSAAVNASSSVRPSAYDG